MRRFEKPIVLALFACWVIGFGALIWGTSNHSPVKQNTHGTGYAKEQANAPSQRSSAIHAHEKGMFDTFFEIKLTDVALIFFTAMLAWRTSGLFTETAGLRDAAEKQRTDSLRSIAATEIAAKAAQQSAGVAEKALFAANHPLLTISELELRESDQAANRPPHIHWGMRNSGTGIAVVISIDVKTGTKEKVGLSIVSKSSHNVLEWIGAIEPGDIATGNRISTPSIQAKFNEILIGNVILYFQLTIQLEDVFKNPSIERFPFVFNPETKAFQRTSAMIEGREKSDSDEYSTGLS
jgi:hypothetical protein